MKFILKKEKIVRPIKRTAEAIRPAAPYLYGAIAIGMLLFILLDLSIRDREPDWSTWILLETVIAMTAGGMAYLSVRTRKNKPSLDAISRLLRANNLKPIDEDKDENSILVQTPDAQTTYAFLFDDPQFFLRYPFYCSGDLQKARAAAAEVMDQRFMVKICVEQTDDPQNNLFVNIAIETTLQRMDLLQEILPFYLRIVNSAAQLFLEKFETPDEPAACRRTGIYDPEYRWFPMLVETISNGKIALEALADEDWLRTNIQQICGEAFVQEWNTFRIKSINTYGNYKLFVYEFPEPREIPEARYGAVWIETLSRQAEYYTLEYSLDNRWVMGSMTREQHANYGSIDAPDLKRFILWILESNKEPECCLKRRSEGVEPVN